MIYSVESCRFFLNINCCCGVILTCNRFHNLPELPDLERGRSCELPDDVPPIHSTRQGNNLLPVKSDRFSRTVLEK